MPQQSPSPTSGTTISPAVVSAESSRVRPLDPAAQAFVDGLAGGKPISSLTPAQARDVLSGIQSATAIAVPDVQIKDVTLPLGLDRHTNIRVMRPAGATGVLPAIVYMHGGGWVMGGKDTHDRLIREITVGANAT